MVYQSLIHLVIMFATSANVPENALKVQSDHVRYQLPYKNGQNWKDSVIATGISGDKAFATYRLKNGKQEVWREGCGYDVSLESVYKLDSRHTVLVITESGGCGTSFETGIVQVVSLDQDSAIITQEISYDAQSPNAGTRFNPKSGRLKLQGRSAEIAHSHPTAEDEAVFKWNGWRFVLLKWRRIPLPPG